jgi:hypothetical protein
VAGPRLRNRVLALTRRGYGRSAATLQAYQQEVLGPARLAGQEQFRFAFGDDLRLVRLATPMVESYEYRDAPDLIERHVRRFLAEVNSAELTRRNSVVSWLAHHAMTPGPSTDYRGFATF